MNKNEMYMIHGTDYTEMTKKLLKEANLAELIPNAQCKIGIKPNLVSPSEASYGATTHPEIVAGIIEYLQENSFSNLIMLEGSWVGDKTEDSVIACGFDHLVERYKVPFIDMQKDAYVEKDCDGMSLLLCKTPVELDFLINVPVMKGHCQTKITCALKNIKGLIPNKEKRHFHAMGLHRPIAHLNKGIRQDFVVVDNICGDWDFEDGGNPVVMNRIMAFRDPVLCDSFVCNQMGYTKEEVPYICYAEELGIGDGDLSKLVIHSLNDAKEVVELPKVRKTVELKDAVEEVESCSACYGYLLPALDMLKQEGLFEYLKEKICIGQGYRDKTGRLGVGNCTRKFEHTVKGCPPTEMEIYEFLKKYIKESQEVE